MATFASEAAPFPTPYPSLGSGGQDVHKTSRQDARLEISNFRPGPMVELRLTFLI
jgi:hypothetical protein